MSPEDWRALAREVNRDIAMLTRASKTRADVRTLLDKRRRDVTEEQIIDMHSFGISPGEPRVVTVAGNELKIWKIHRLGLDLSDVKGADLYYELGNKKFVLVQYKKPNAADRVGLDEEQLRELQDACPVPCPPVNRYSCGSWYALHRLPNSVYLPACEARERFRKYASRKSAYFYNGLSQSEFHEEFGACHIGARTEPVEVSDYEAFAVKNDRMLVRVQNRSAR